MSIALVVLAVIGAVFLLWGISGVLDGGYEGMGRLVLGLVMLVLCAFGFGMV